MNAAFFRRIWELWNQHEAQRLAASLAYYTILSLAPLLLIIVALGALLLGKSAAHYDTIHEVRRLAGGQAAGIADALLNARPTSWGGWAATGLGALIMLFGASSVFAELRESLNFIWDAGGSQKSWYREIIHERLFAFAMVLGLGLLMTVVNLGGAAFAIAVRALALPYSTLFVNAVRLGATLVVTSLVFCLIFRYVPSIRISWKDAWIGAIVTAVLYDLVRIPLDVYLLHGHIGSAYGAAGSLVAFLFWVYWSAQVFYLGGEFTRVYSERFGTFAQRKR